MAPPISHAHVVLAEPVALAQTTYRATLRAEVDSRLGPAEAAPEGVADPALLRFRAEQFGAGRVRVYFPEFEGAAIDGPWTVEVSSDGAGLLSEVALFAEGFGLDTGGASGRGTAHAGP